MRKALGPQVPVVLVRGDVRPGDALTARRLGVRRVPARYAPRNGYSDPAALEGTRAAVALAGGTDLVPALVDDGARPGPHVKAGQRVAEIVARATLEHIAPGGRVDVLITREAPDGRGQTTLAMQDLEVLAARRAEDDATGQRAGPRVAVSLRTSLHQAVELVAAESFAREIRLLPRGAG